MNFKFTGANGTEAEEEFIEMEGPFLIYCLFLIKLRDGILQTE